MRQSDVLAQRREQERKAQEIQEIQRLNANKRTVQVSATTPRAKRQSRKVAPPTNMRFIPDDLVSDDSPIASLFADRLVYRAESRDTAHKTRMRRNSDSLPSAIRTPRQRSRNDYQYGINGERSGRSA